MTLDEAIQHCEKVAISKTKQVENGDWEKGSSTERDCIACASEHQQLAEWLKELKTLKVSRKELLNDIDMAIKASNMDDAYSVGLRNGMRVIKSFIDDEKPEYEKCCHEESCSEIPNTCGDAVSRQAVLNAMYELCSTGETLKENPWRDNPHIDAVVEAIEELPSVTPRQRTGRWMKEGQGGRYKWMCSNCGTHHRALYDYCPSCGTKMEVEE